MTRIVLTLAALMSVGAAVLADDVTLESVPPVVVRFAFGLPSPMASLPPATSSER